MTDRTHFCDCFWLQLAGAAVLGVGIWVKVDSGSILNFLQNVEQAPSELGQLLNVGYLLIAVGAVLLILGFLGCCGAIRESKCMLLLVGHIISICTCLSRLLFISSQFDIFLYYYGVCLIKRLETYKFVLTFPKHIIRLLY